MKKAFIGTSEIEVFDRVKDIITMFGKTQKRTGPTRTFGRKGQYSLICLIEAIDLNIWEAIEIGTKQINKKLLQTDQNYLLLHVILSCSS